MAFSFLLSLVLALFLSAHDGCAGLLTSLDFLEMAFFLKDGLALHPGWGAVLRSQLTSASTSSAQVIPPSLAP